MLPFLVFSVAAQLRTTWREASNEYFNNGDSLSFVLNGAKNTVELTDDGFILSSKGYITDEFKPDTDRPVMLQFGPTALLEFRDDTKDFIQQFSSVAYNPLGKPHIATIEYDRTFRVYNRMNKIVWEWPETHAKKQQLELTRGALDIYDNYLRRGEYLMSKDGRWFVYLNRYGALIDNNGNVLNKNGVSSFELPCILEMTPYGGIYIADKTGTRLTTFIEDPVDTPLPIAGSVLLSVTDKGVLQRNDGKVLFDLSAKGEPINSNYFPLISVDQGFCVTQNGARLTMEVCTAGNFKQLFSYHGDYFRVLSDPSKCVARSDTSLVVTDCSADLEKIIFSNVMQDGTIRTKDNMCFDNSGDEVKLSSCELWETNKNMFTWTQNYVNPQKLKFMHIYNSDKSLLISSYANGWWNGNLSEILPLRLMNENDNVKWAFDDAKRLRFSPSPAYCMQVYRDTVIPQTCNETTSTWTYVNNKIYDQGKFNCLVQDNDNIKFGRCKAEPGNVWYMLDTPAINPGHNTTNGDYKPTDMYSMFDGKLLGKLGIDNMGHLHKEDFCYSPELREIACDNQNLGKFAYQDHQLHLKDTNLVVNSNFQLEDNIYAPTQFIAVGNYTVTKGPQSNIYNLQDGTCLGIVNGKLRTKDCNTAENFFVGTDNKIGMSINIDFCLDGDKTTLCEHSKPFKTVRPIIEYTDGQCLTASGLKECGGSDYFSLNKTDILPKNMLFDNIYQLGGDQCIGVDDNQRAVPTICDNKWKWAFANGKIRSKNNPFQCLEKNANNKIVYAPCDATVWKDNTLVDNSFSTDGQCLTSDTQYYVGRCSGLPTQRYSFNNKTTIREFTKLISYDNSYCLQADSDAVSVQKCLDDDRQKWSYGTDGSVLHVSGRCLGNQGKLEDCGITKWAWDNKLLKYNNKCLTSNLAMEPCTQEVRMKWEFTKALDVPVNKFYTIYHLSNDDCLISCDAKIAITGGHMYDGSNPNRCYDSKLQSILCVLDTAKWSFDNNQITYDKQCLSKDSLLEDCNNNRADQMWGTERIVIDTPFESFAPPLAVTNVSHLIIPDANNTEIKFTLDKNNFIRSELNPYYCLDASANFGPCDKAIPWSRQLVSNTLCFDGKQTVPCNDDLRQKWYLGKPPVTLEYREYVNFANGLCLTPGNGKAILDKCNENSQWAIDENDHLRTKNGLCLESTLNLENVCDTTWYYDDMHIVESPFLVFPPFPRPKKALEAEGSNLVLKTYTNVPSQRFGDRSQVPPNNLIFEEITHISAKRCLGRDTATDILQIYDCNGQDNQGFSIQNGQIRIKADPAKCLQQDLHFTTDCVANTWDYDRNTGRIQYVPSGGVLDAGRGPYLNPTWFGNSWQVFGPRSRWVPDNLVFEEITHIATRKCLDADSTTNILQTRDCNNAGNQKLSVQNGQIRAQQDPTKCLQQDLHFTTNCVANTWDYDRNTGRIQYVPSRGVLDAGNGLYLNPTWVGNSWQVFGPRSQIPDNLVFEEITHIATRKCLDRNAAADVLQIYDCNGTGNQGFSIQNGQIRVKVDPVKCLQQDLHFTTDCVADTWDYDRNTGRILHIPSRGVLDAGNGLYLYPTWVGNSWQVFGDRSRWASDYKNIRSLQWNLIFNNVNEAAIASKESWSKFSYANGKFYIPDKGVMYCLTVNVNNLAVLTTNCGAAVEWTIVGDSIRTGGQCLDTRNNKLGANIGLWGCNGTPAQYWKF